jgi:hypothetical protein
MIFLSRAKLFGNDSCNFHIRIVNIDNVVLFFNEAFALEETRLQ